MPGFFPIVGTAHELNIGPGTCNADEKPIEREKQRIRYHTVLFLFESRQEMGDDIETIAENKIGESGRMNEGVYRDAPDIQEPEEGDAPEHEIENGEEEVAAENNARPKKFPPADFVNKREWMSGVNEEGEEETFLPAGSLTNPVAKPTICFFKRVGIHDDRALTLAENAQAEIGVFGDIVWIPHAKPA